MSYSVLQEQSLWLQENGFYWVDWNASGWDSGFHSFDVGGDAISSNRGQGVGCDFDNIHGSAS